ncbi:hypothetical protein FEK35_16800 [Nocardia cyriacigeorgica]|uniref:Sodium/calcium exchanger membrane region domain-containing protein n=1 Tax=Nocardia cyriacigeorgica TaxID=135487 RepID=A0A5R8PCX8_9NOCA|nr:hypothetical protein [Nocardia cyriacigeorgica]TLG08835.1 hypothetical protein FEK35_16800 [Nocardia cyriacigeorgica]
MILFGIFAVYLVRVSRVESDEEDEEGAGVLVGSAAWIAAGSVRTRRWSAVAMLVLAAGAILLMAEPFAESLVDTGAELGISQFLLVQWVAPLASETPEFIAVLILVWTLRRRWGRRSSCSSYWS